MTAPQPRYTITLESVAGELSKQQIRDLLKADLKLSDERINALFESLPAIVLEDVDEITAVRTKQKLSWSGADVSIQPSAELGDDDETVRRPHDVGVDLRDASDTGSRLAGPVEPGEEPSPSSTDEGTPWLGDEKVEVGGVPVDDLSWLQDKKDEDDIPGEGMSWLEEQKLKADELTPEEISSLQGDAAASSESDMAEPAPEDDREPVGIDPPPASAEPPAEKPKPPPRVAEEPSRPDDDQMTTRIPPPGMRTPPPKPPKPDRPPAEAPRLRVPTRTELGVASPSEQRVERLKKTIGQAREEEPEQFPHGEAPYDDEPSHGFAPSTKYAFVGIVLLVAIIWIAMFFVKESREWRKDSQLQEQAQRDYDTRYQKGLRAEKERRYSEAIGAYEDALIYVKAKEAQGAIERVQHLIRVETAEEALAEGRIEDAIRAYELAHEKRQTDEVSREISRLREELKERRTDQARSARIQDLTDRADLLEAGGDWQGAANTLKQLAQFGHSPAHRQRVRLARMEAMTTASAPQPSDTDRDRDRKATAWIERARKHFQAGNESEAVRAARYTLKLSPNHPTALRILNQAEKPQARIETRAGTTSVTASVAKQRPRRTIVTRPPPVARPVTPKAPVHRATSSTVWPTSKGSTWRYQSTRDRSLITTYRALGPVIRGGISCYAYEISKTRNNSTVAPVRTLVLAQRPGGLYRVLDVGKEVKHYELPLSVGQLFSYKSAEAMGQAGQTKPANVQVTTERRETIQTPAGRFDCFVVKRATRRVNFDRRTAQITSIDEE